MYIYSIISNSYTPYIQLFYDTKDIFIEKIGSTKYIECRKFDGLTFLPCSLTYKWYIKIHSLGIFTSLIQLEHFIHNHIKNMHFETNGGGSEFFYFTNSDSSLEFVKKLLDKNDISYNSYKEDKFTKRPPVSKLKKYYKEKMEILEKEEILENTQDIVEKKVCNKYKKCNRTKCNKEKGCICSKDTYITITPISGKKKKNRNKKDIDKDKENICCPLTDYIEQISRTSKGFIWMWDDGKHNTSNIGDYFAFFLVESTIRPIGKVIIHKIINILDPKHRLPSWHKNIGQRDRNVLILSEIITEITMKDWKTMGGGMKKQGTYSTKINEYVNKYILEKINNKKYFFSRTKEKETRIVNTEEEEKTE